MRFFWVGNRKFYLFAILIILPFFLLASIAIFSPQPPLEKLEKCRKMVAKARTAEADKYAPSELKKAEGFWEQAMAEWKLQNKKSIAFRDFSKLSNLISESSEFAEKSTAISIKTKKDLTESILNDITSLKKINSQIEYFCQKLPLNHGIRQKLTPTNLKLSEAEAAFKRNDLLVAKNRIDEVKTKILNLKNLTTETLEKYFSDFKTWQSINQEMITWSKINDGVSLVVDKFSRKCYVYRSGKQIHEYDVELGINWLGDKQFRGDKATPEGKYKITKKKSAKDTRYYKALLINFPNEEDMRRFKSAKERGVISKSAQIGGLIEIHGEGGKGIDWTEGCVALDNRDMDKIFSLCSVGTPVAIVGSLKSITELFDL
jgi:hypothetical protein